MASIQKRVGTRGTTYVVRWRLPTGESRKHSCRTRKEADRLRSTVETDIARGQWSDPVQGRVTFADWVDQYLASAKQSKRATTYERDTWVIKTHLLPALGPKRLASITPFDVRQVVDKMAERLAPATVRTNYGVLKAILNAATQADLIGRSPCRGIKLGTGRAHEVRALTADDIVRLAESTPPQYRPMVYLAGTLGLRWSEVAGLTVKRVDVLRRRLEIAETLSNVGGMLLRADVKARASRRVLELPTFMAEMLAEHLAARGLSGVDGDAFVFASPEGGPLHPSNFRSRVWLPATEDANLKGVRFHDLRHSAASLLIEGGLPLPEIQRRIGHSSIRTTIDVYGHLTETTERAATDHLEGLFRQAARPKRAQNGNGSA